MSVDRLTGGGRDVQRRATRRPDALRSASQRRALAMTTRRPGSVSVQHDETRNLGLVRGIARARRVMMKGLLWSAAAIVIIMLSSSAAVARDRHHGGHSRSHARSAIHHSALMQQNFWPSYGYGYTAYAPPPYAHHPAYSGYYDGPYVYNDRRHYRRTSRHHRRTSHGRHH